MNTWLDDFVVWFALVAIISSFIGLGYFAGHKFNKKEVEKPKWETIGICSVSYFSDLQKGYVGRKGLKDGDVSISQDLYNQGILGLNENITINGCSREYITKTKMDKFQGDKKTLRTRTIDIFCRDIEQCKRLGRRKARVFVLTNY